MSDAKGRVTGIGGIFFKGRDHKALRSWYVQHLGIKSEDWGAMFEWREHDNPEIEGVTTWNIFPADTKYFGDSAMMINYRVENLDALLKVLQEEGVRIDSKREDADYGRFAWIYDPEGNKIELWEPARAEKEQKL
jgi:predicted enzyme related to lactoylglutathione lyase